MRHLHVLRDLLDDQIVDRGCNPIGRVDSILAELRDGAPPRVVELQLGFVPLARRFGLRAERWMEALHKRFSVRRSARYGIPWEKVTEIHAHHIEVDLDVEDTVAADWERWFRQNVIGRIPGSGRKS